MAIRDAEHQAADPESLRLDGRGRERRDRIEAVAVAASAGRLLKVIGDREPVEPALVRESPEPSHLIERTAEVADLDAELHRRP